MRQASRDEEFGCINEHRFSSQICGLVSTAKAMGNFMILTKSQCLQVSLTIFTFLYHLACHSQYIDYRIPQILHFLGCLMYSPPLDNHIRSLKTIPSGSNWEIELRATSIWCVELIRREIERRHPEVKKERQQQAQQKQQQQNEAFGNSNGVTEIEEKKCTTQKHSKRQSLQEPNVAGVNAILIDFFLYDTMKDIEREGRETIPHHRTRSIWY